MVLRLAIAAALVLAVIVVTLRHRRRRPGLVLAVDGDIHARTPPVPAELIVGAARTWVVFTTPYCVSCGPVEERLRAADPDARVVRIDTTRELALADAFGVRAAPTVLLADDTGRVQARLVGAAAVTRYVTDGQPH